MLDPEKTEIIIAGPGVGKTTELLNRVEKALGEGVPPVDIAFFSFSTTAVNEGLDRITKRMAYRKNQFRYFKTLHAMAFSLLGIHTKQVMSYQLLKQFAQDNDMKISAIDYRTGIKRFQTPDMILLGQLESARMLGLSVREYFVKFKIEEPSIEKAEDIAAKYHQFKLANGVVDFTDMILLANKTELDTPHFQYMFIDEAQDLSTQQWMFVERLAQNADHVVVVGDERQAIADFAGADVDYFLNIKGKTTTLCQSYRVPRNIYNLARKVEKHMIKTRNARWKPRPLDFMEEQPGEIIRINELPIREMARGSWLILTRTNAQLTEFKDYLMKACDVLPAYFTVDGEPPLDADVFKAIQIFQAMQYNPNVSKYDFITVNDDDSEEDKKKKEKFILLLKKFMSSKCSWKPELDTVFMHRFSYRNWWDAFDRMTMLEKRYVKKLVGSHQRNPDMFKNAKIKLSTIHSAKGMEADNVILYTTLSGKVYNEWKNNEENDSEVKVLFVGVTRARKKLYLLGSNTNYSYEEILK